MKIYDVPSIMATATPLALTPNNIMSGFRVSGIFPLNPDIFTDADFMPAYFTDRPAPVQAEVYSPITGQHEEADIQGPTQPNVGCPTPEEVRPLEKAGPRKQTCNGRRKRKSAILTDTPVKEQLRLEQQQAKQRKQNKFENEKKEKKNVKKKII